MNKKISLGTVIGLIAIAIAITSAITMNAVKLSYNSILKNLPERSQRYALLEELQDIIDENYYGKRSREELLSSLGEGYVNSLGDTDDKFMTGEEYKEYLREKSGNMSGIGAKTERVKNTLKITKVYSNSPAKKAGLKAGDIIVGFDGIKLNKSNFKELTGKLNGENLSSVNIIYKRDKTEKSVTLMKGYEIPSVEWDVYENVGYLKIADFFSKTADDLKVQTEKLVSSGMKAIIIDLRENESTNYDYMLSCLDIFVPMDSSDNHTFKVADENGNIIKTLSTTPGEVNIPVAILASTKTKAAAEFFCSAMKDFSKAVIFSDGNTAGDVSLMEVFELSNGSAVLLTVGKVQPYKGESYEDEGITPDYIYESDSKGTKLSEDSQFVYAVSVLTE
jgi:carboxyl-terminal processing protease